MSLLDKIREYIARKHADLGGVKVPSHGDHYRVMTQAERAETLESAASQWEIEHDEDLDYKHSLVDLMKLTGQDFSLKHRKELAVEFGWKGDLTDTSATAAMNQFLYPLVLKKLEIAY